MLQRFTDEDIFVVCEVCHVEGCESLASENKELVVVMSIVPDQDMLDEAVAREVTNRVQRLRKEAGLQIADEIDVFYDVPEPSTNGGATPGEGDTSHNAQSSTRLREVLAAKAGQLARSIGRPFSHLSTLVPGAVEVVRATREVEGVNMEIVIARAAPVVDLSKVAPNVAQDLQHMLLSYDPSELKQRLAASGGKMEVQLNGEKLALVAGEHFAFRSVVST